MELERHGLKVVLRKIDNFLPGDGELSARRPRRADAGRDRPPPRRRRRGLRPLHRRARDGRPAHPEMAAACAARSRGGDRGPADACSAWAASSPGSAPTKSAPSTNMPPRARATSSTAISRATSPRPCSGSTASSAISLRPTRRARPTSCSTICSARRRAFPAPGAMRSAGWGRSPRRWPAPRREAGVDILLNTPVEEVIVESGRAAGVVAGGKAWRATNTIAGVNPRLLFDRLVPKGVVARQGRAPHGQLGVRKRDLPDECRAVDKLPNFTVLPGQGRSSDLGHHHGAEPRLYGPRLRRREA